MNHPRSVYDAKCNECKGMFVLDLRSVHDKTISIRDAIKQVLPNGLLCEECR